jgi:hypothetical protein
MRIGVASQALRVVERVVADDSLVWIMAGEAANATIHAVKTFAVRKAVRLEAGVTHAAPPASHYQFPRPMALSAKV